MKKLSHLVFAFTFLPLFVFGQEKVLKEAFERAEEEGFSGIVLVADNGEILSPK